MHGPAPFSFDISSLLLRTFIGTIWNVYKKIFTPEELASSALDWSLAEELTKPSAARDDCVQAVLYLLG